MRRSSCGFDAVTPGARIAAAIEILDTMHDGLAAEQALTRWARRSRFAGSKDRAAIRDHVFDVLRRRREALYYGNGATGRTMILGLLRAQGVDPKSLFTGEGHAPAPLSDIEAVLPEPPKDETIAWNLPLWLIDHFKTSLGEQASDSARALQDRAPVCLRVNIAKITVEAAASALAAEGIETSPNPHCDTALSVLEGARKIRNSNAFLEGLVELQDAASQAVVATLSPGGQVLDYCAGGGGKSLALAMDTTRHVFAHDIDPARMRDLPPRAARAGATITAVETKKLTESSFDTVLCDAPCSGSGAWRRAPEGKWTLTPERLLKLNEIQDDILKHAAGLVRPGGVLAYATCSVLRSENEDRIAAFTRLNPRWKVTFSKRFSIDTDGDGFFVAHLTQE